MEDIGDYTELLACHSQFHALEFVEEQMKSYESLTRAGQLRRLRSLAVKALAAYELYEFQLTPLQHEGNTTFRVDMPSGERYVLRIHYPGLRTVESIQSEMNWLAALRRETDFVVPEPMPAYDGSLVTVISVEEVREPRICVLFRWIPGHFLDARLTPSHLERVGVFMAGLQLHGAQFRPPNGFVRGRLDTLTQEGRQTAARGTSEALARGQADNPADETTAIRLVTEICSREDGAQVAVLIRKMRETQQTVGQAPEIFGLIHGDLHQGNFFFHQGQVRAIDFDDCGYEHYLYDIAVTLSEVNWRSNTPELRQGFLRGYRSVRELPSKHEDHLDTFILFRDLQLLIWKIEMRNHPAFRDTWASSVKEMLQDIRNFVER
jgi:Ser/Thr protein kinase RdoA (MazF antagonist)